MEKLKTLNLSSMVCKSRAVHALGCRITPAHLPPDARLLPRRLGVGRSLLIALILVIGCFEPSVSQCLAQPSQVPGDAGPKIVHQQAFAGAPFGVGVVRFRLPQNDKQIAQTQAIEISAEGNRLFYPTFSSGFLGRILGGGAPDTDRQITAHFLFTGEEPLTVSVKGHKTTTFELTPEVPTRRMPVNRMWRTWWSEYNQSFHDNDDYPPSFEVYLTSMLGKRLGLRPTVRARRHENPHAMQMTMDLLFNVESIRARTINSMMNSPPDFSPADQALPPAVDWLLTPVAPPAERPKTEKLVDFVPQECFYVRFGTWQNQIWLKRLMADFDGDLGGMVQFRGYKYPGQEKLMQQLLLESNEVDDMLGGSVVKDVAFIGTDMYANDGSTAGVMFESKSRMFVNNLIRRRKAAAKKDEQRMGLQLDEIKVGDVDVSFLHSSHNRIRSYLVSHDNVHLVTNSRYLVDRFVDCIDGKGRLSDDPEFQHARSILPLEREDTIFAFMSSHFFHNLMNPQYQIELRRRSQLTAEVQMLQMATMIAKNERLKFTRIEDLIEHDLLPESFGHRVDGGRLEFDSKGFVDSLRGAQGYFLPIADVQIDRCSGDESDWYHQRASYYQETLKRVDPLFVAIKRYELKGEQAGVERLVFEARVAPFAKEQYEWAGDMLGRPTRQRVVMNDCDAIRVQASMKALSSDEFQMFFALQDDSVPISGLSPTNFMELMKILKTTPGYLGAWPKPGFLDFLPRLGGEPDINGYTYSRLLDLWRLQHNDFSLLSFDYQRLEDARARLDVDLADRPAQFRIDIRDLSGTELSRWVDNINYRISWQNSIANVRLLNTLIHQFGIAPDQAKSVAESMLGLQLICNLGGEFQLAELKDGRTVWMSSAWPSFTSPRLADEYRSPLLKWFRGLHAEATEENGQFLLYGWVDIQRKGREKGEKEPAKLPGFNLFKGFKKAEELPPALPRGEKRPIGGARTTETLPTPKVSKP